MTVSLPLTRTIAEIACNTQFDNLPDDVVRMARLALIDALGCFYRGGGEPLVKIIAEEFGITDWSAEKLLPGAINGIAANNLALLFGASTHAIDYDDSHALMPGHIGAPVISAIMAQSRTAHYSFEEILEATVAGYEVAARVGQLLTPEHYGKGFHTTSTIGMFGAAAATAKLLKLSVEQTCQAFGVTLTQVAGVKSTFGTMAKPFNAGNAAASGLLAARLVAKGFTAPDNGLEVPQGLLDLFDGKAESDIHIAPGSEYLILQNMFKLYASCHFTHPCIDGIAMMMREYTINADIIESITVKVAPLSFKTAGIVEPTSGLECKFSFPQVVAMALCGRDLTDDALFSDVMLSDNAVNTMRSNVSIETVETQTPDRVVYHLSLSGGESFDFEYSMFDHMPTLDQLEPQVINKYRSNAGFGIGKERAETLLAQLISDVSSVSL
ncbi:MmgE/PrpD family protein [Maricurvus nonylphenolicus]|uniref:MmgE/PrpD family protein n=1 Tax=Maricurvus nonylphenolicus TaxID=1008307 RepID=UPI0036F1E957